MDIKELLHQDKKTQDWIIYSIIALVCLFVIVSAINSLRSNDQADIKSTDESKSSSLAVAMDVSDDSKSSNNKLSRDLEAFAQEKPTNINVTDTSAAVEESQTSDNLSANVTENDSEFVLGLPEPVEGTPLMMLPLISGQDDSPTANIGQRTAAKNILFMNTKNNSSYWMFDNPQRLIVDINQFPNSFGYTPDSQGTEAIFYDTVSRDSNQDGLIDEKDKLSLAISTPEGRNYRTVLSSYDKIISKSLTEDNSVFMVYQNDGQSYSMLFTMNPFQVISNRALPKMSRNIELPYCPDNLENGDDAIDCAIYHGGEISDLTNLEHQFTTERSGSYWVVKQQPEDGIESYWEFVLSSKGKLMSMKQFNQAAEN
ncbi:MAG: hypothetical protein KJO88_06305 [Gammaproteobacteria bacterium]|nr:hypothetical protein [Gammaproteobacteria bacterium]NNM12818.1 hypothetical protein [Gammaproteobacteria bacterium]